MLKTSLTPAIPESNNAQSIGEYFVVALRERDPKKLAACFDSDVRLRALVPSGFKERKGAEDAVAQILYWFREAERIELVQKQIYPISQRNHISYRFREVYADGEVEVIEQQAFCYIRNGLIESIDIVCSGHLPDRSGMTDELQHHLYDAGDMGCSSELPQEFRRQIGSIPIGHILEVSTRDPSAREDLPSLARLLGHKVLSVKSSDGITVVSVQRGR